MAEVAVTVKASADVSGSKIVKEIGPVVLKRWIAWLGITEIVGAWFVGGGLPLIA